MVRIGESRGAPLMLEAVTGILQQLHVARIEVFAFEDRFVQRLRDLFPGEPERLPAAFPHHLVRTGDALAELSERFARERTIVDAGAADAFLLDEHGAQ